MSIKQKDCTTRRHISAAGPLTTRDVYRVLLWGICFLQKQGWCLTLEKSPWNQLCPGRELHGRDMPQFLMPWIFFEMDRLGACWMDLLSNREITKLVSCTPPTQRALSLLCHTLESFTGCHPCITAGQCQAKANKPNGADTRRHTARITLLF